MKDLYAALQADASLMEPVSLPSKQITVAILNWNGEDLLPQFLPSVLNYTPSEIAEVLVIDNGSEDHSLELLRNAFPEVRILAFDLNEGFAGGYNRAMKEISTPLVCLLNSDVEVSEGWLEAPLALFQKHPEVAAVQPKILDYKAPSYFEYAGASGGFLDVCGYPFCRGRIFDTVEKDKGQYDNAVEIAWASGAALFLRREAFLSVGGFDERFFCHMEEIDLAWRLIRKGYSLMLSPESVVYHLGGATLSASDSQKTYYNYRNNLLMLAKNLPDRQLKSILRKRRLLDRVASIRLRFFGKKNHAQAIRKAWRDFQAFPKPIDESRLPKCNILTPIPLVWEYYLLGHKRYSTLSQKYLKRTILHP